MFRNVTPEKAIAFTHLVFAFSYCWPLPLEATRFQLIRFKIIRFFLFLNIIAILIPLIYAMHVHRGDAEIVSKAGCMGLSFVKDTLQMSFCMAHYKHFQRLVEEMKAFCAGASVSERRVLHEYVNRFSKFYGVSAAWLYLTGSIVMFGGLATGDFFPTRAEYPFPVDIEPLKSIIFVHQVFAVLQITSHVCASIFCALLMLFAAARYEILKNELRAVESVDELVECVRKYFIVRRYANDVVDAFRFIALFTVGVCVLAAVLCGITFLGKQPMTMKLPFAFVAATAFLEVFMCAWPADHLMYASENVMQGAYESEWYRQSITVQKSILVMLVPQPPVAIRISCVISIFSMTYYCSFVSNVFSVFTALRVVMLDE